MWFTETKGYLPLSYGPDGQIAYLPHQSEDAPFVFPKLYDLQRAPRARLKLREIRGSTRQLVLPSDQLETGGKLNKSRDDVYIHSGHQTGNKEDILLEVADLNILLQQESFSANQYLLKRLGLESQKFISTTNSYDASIDRLLDSTSVNGVHVLAAASGKLGTVLNVALANYHKEIIRQPAGESENAGTSQPASETPKYVQDPHFAKLESINLGLKIQQIEFIRSKPEFTNSKGQVKAYKQHKLLVRTSSSFFIFHISVTPGPQLLVQLLTVAKTNSLSELSFLAYNPFTLDQLFVIDIDGNWKLFQLSYRRRKAAVPRVEITETGNGYFAGQNSISGFKRCIWGPSVDRILLISRHVAIELDISARSSSESETASHAQHTLLHEVTEQLLDNTLLEFKDILRAEGTRNEYFLLTSDQLLWVSYSYDESSGRPQLTKLLSWKHFLDSQDPSLYLTELPVASNNTVDSQRHTVIVQSRLTFLSIVYEFCMSNGFPRISRKPYDVPIVLPHHHSNLRIQTCLFLPQDGAVCRFALLDSFELYSTLLAVQPAASAPYEMAARRPFRTQVLPPESEAALADIRSPPLNSQTAESYRRFFQLTMAILDLPDELPDEQEIGNIQSLAFQLSQALFQLKARTQGSSGTENHGSSGNSGNFGSFGTLGDLSRYRPVFRDAGEVDSMLAQFFDFFQEQGVQFRDLAGPSALSPALLGVSVHEGSAISDLAAGLSAVFAEGLEGPESEAKRRLTQLVCHAVVLECVLGYHRFSIAGPQNVAEGTQEVPARSAGSAASVTPVAQLDAALARLELGEMPRRVLEDWTSKKPKKISKKERKKQEEYQRKLGSVYSQPDLPTIGLSQSQHELAHTISPSRSAAQSQPPLGRIPDLHHPRVESLSEYPPSELPGSSQMPLQSSQMTQLQSLSDSQYTLSQSQAQSQSQSRAKQKSKHRKRKLGGFR